MAAIKTFKALWQLSRAEWLLLAEAGLCLAAVRLALWILPFRQLASRFGKVMEVSPADHVEAQGVVALQIGWAVRAFADRIPLVRQCLVQALTATWMLQRRGIPSTLYFGLAKNGSGQLKDLLAHAWVRSGTKVLTGARGRDEYTVVATFADPSLYEKTVLSSCPADGRQQKEVLK